MKIEDLPRPANYRRQMAKNGGYEMVPAYTAEEVLGILEKTKTEAVMAIYEQCAQIAFDADHIGSVNMKLMKNRIGHSILASTSTIDAAIKKGQV